MTNERVLWDAEFNPAVKLYWLLSGTLVLIVTVVGIPLLPVWLLAGNWVTGRYLASYRCTLTNRSLKVAKGLLVRREKTVPLDRITDLGLIQGPIMRMLKIEALSVETAGQSSQGSLVQLTGIREGRAFRDAVLRQRDLVVGSREESDNEPRPGEVSRPVAADSAESVALLREIRDALYRVEQQLGDRTGSPARGNAGGRD